MEDVVCHIGVQVEALERWQEEAQASGGVQKSWTTTATLDAVVVTAAIDEAAKSAWCHTNGILCMIWSRGARARYAPWAMLNQWGPR